MATFCQSYIGHALTLTQLSIGFLLVSLVAAAAMAIAEVIAKFRTAASVRTDAGTQAKTVQTLIDALKGLVTALASAPVWLALFAVGIMLFWVPGSAVSGLCPGDKAAACACPVKAK